MGTPSNNPLPRVDRPRKGEPLDHRWGARVADAILALAQRGIREPARPATRVPAHPWKIVVVDSSGLKLRVHYGNVARMKMFQDSGGTDLMGLEEVSVGIGLAGLIGDPAGGGVGEISLPSDDVYGIWIEFTTTRDVDNWVPASSEYINLSDYEFQSGTVVAKTGTPGDAPADAAGLAAATSGKAYKWIGRVTVSGGVVTAIDQYLRSDLVLPGFAVPYALISTDSGNALVAGSDNGLKVVPVSTDANNDIGTGSDGGAYLRLIAGTDISITGSAGTKTITDVTP